MKERILNYFSDIFNNFNQTIGYLIFKKIFLGYIFLVLTLASYQIFSEYNKAQNELINDLKRIENLFIDDLTKAVMNNNKERIDKIIEIILKDDLISGITFEINKEKILRHKQNINNENFVSYSYSIFDTAKNPRKYLASIQLFASKDIIKKESKKSIMLIIINILISVLMFWILVITYTNLYLTIPLKKLINGIKSFEEHEEERSHIKLQLNNLRELTVLADSFNKMSSKISEDIINLRQLTMIQNLQKKALEQANRAKDDFLANMSHELKTPLNSINLISSIMLKNKDKKLNEKEVKNLEIINRCGNDLLFLINDVLDISKLEAGKLELYYETIDVKELMYEINDMFEPQVLEKDLEFKFEFDNKINLIYSDKQRIKQIVKNLLSNSLKFVHEGEIRLLVKDKEEFVEIIVSDDGIGIEKDKLETIFDRFKQVDGSTTRKYGGTGLGLAICRDLTGLFKGDIKIESEIDKGTTITVLIPKNLDQVNKCELQKEEEKLITKKAKKTKNETLDFLFDEELENKESKKKRSIAILNNDHLSYMSLVIELNKNYRVQQSASLKDFISKTKEEKFDLLIVDIDSVTKEQLRNYILEKEEKIILVSKEKTDIENQEIVEKPFDTNQMVTTILKRLDS